MIAVALYSFHRDWRDGAGVREIAERAMAAGADGVEVLDVQLGLRGLPLKMARERAAQAREELSGIPVLGYAATPVFGGPGDRADTVARLRLAREEAATHGAKSVRVFSADAQEGVSRERAFADAVAGLREVGEGSPPLALENHGTLFDSAEHLEAFLGAVPGLKTTFDAGNFRLRGHDPISAAQRLAGTIVNVHLKDFANGVPTALGDGDHEVASTIVALRNGGYAGPLTVELEMPENADDLVGRSIAFLRATDPLAAQ